MFFIEFFVTILVLTLSFSRYPATIEAEAAMSILLVVIQVTAELLGIFVAALFILMAIPKRAEITALFKTSQISKVGVSLTLSLMTSAMNYISLCIEPITKSKEFLLFIEFLFIYALIAFGMLIYACIKGFTNELSRKCGL